MKMKILITSIIDLNRAAHSRLHELVKHLCKNHQVTVLSIKDWWKESQTNTKLYRQNFEDIVRTIQVRYLIERKVSPFMQEVFSVFTLNSILREINCASFDVHLNYGTLISGYVVARKLRYHGVNTVYDIADDLPQMIRTSPQIPSLLRPLSGLVGDIMVNRNINVSTKMVCTSQSLRDSCQIPLDKSEIIPNGVDAELFRSYPSKRLRHALGIEMDFVVGYVGVLREWVDFEPLFGALSQLGAKYADIMVLVVGEEGGIKRIKDLANRYGISERVMFSGTVPYTSVPEYISCMDICLVPFKSNPVSHNALPLKLFEYMACEKPIICSPLAGVAETVDEKVLYASNVEEYVGKLLRLYDNRELRDTLGKNGRKLVQESYSWLIVSSRFEELLAHFARSQKHKKISCVGR